MIKFEELKKLLENEIKKAEEDTKNQTEEYKEGYINGLKQALNKIIVEYL